MGDVRKGRQKPTSGITLPYTKTHGEEAVEIYNSTGRTAQEWQELPECKTGAEGHSAPVTACVPMYRR